ncbi:MAG: M23 family metallopeptidase [Mariprofundales bacterium]
MRFLLLVAGLLVAASVTAQEWHASQGDVIILQHPALRVVDGSPSVEIFGRHWPLRRQVDGALYGWVGIDLARKPGRYRVQWQDGSEVQEDWLQVQAGTFRISRIQVAPKMAIFDAEQLKSIRRDQGLLRASYIQPVTMNAEFSFPFMPVEGVISTPFGARRVVNGESRAPHSGLDIAASAGTVIRLPVAGQVLLVASMYLNGNTVVVGHGDGMVEVFSHLQSVAVKQGERLKAGTMLGRVGATGRATGPHLHWGVRFSGARVSPLSLLKQP